MNLENIVLYVKEAQTQRLHIVQFHLNEMSRIGKVIRESVFLVGGNREGI